MQLSWNLDLSGCNTIKLNVRLFAIAMAAYGHILVAVEHFVKQFVPGSTALTTLTTYVVE